LEQRTSSDSQARGIEPFLESVGSVKNSSLLKIAVEDLHEVLPHVPFLDPNYIQLTAGVFRGEFWGFQFPHGLAWGSRSNRGFLGSAGLPPGAQLFALSMPGSEDRWDGRLVGADGLAVGDWSRGLQHRAGENHHIMGWMFPLECYQEASETLGIQFDTELLKRPWITTEVVTLRELLSNLFQHAEARELTFEELSFYENALLRETLSALQSAPRPTNGLRKRPNLAEEVRRYLYEDPEQTLCLTELCRHFNVHRRTLRHHFASEFDISPSQYHLALRLSRVRGLLLAATPAPGLISTAATAFGFWHMGRFGQQYRHLFGETPSETLRRSPSPVEGPEFCRNRIGRLSGSS
jgi:AraC family transcriptional regulator, ethanolamine operon transcriptional activator